MQSIGILFAYSSNIQNNFIQCFDVYKEFQENLLSVRRCLEYLNITPEKNLEEGSESLIKGELARNRGCRVF